MRRLAIIFLIIPSGTFAQTSVSAQAIAGKSAKSTWVYMGANGKLNYKTTTAGDRIMDFSFAGYKSGGASLPEVTVKQTVKPSGNDDTKAIQAAIQAVEQMPLKNGFRGAVLLAPGSYTCSGPILISNNGVVLRGSGSGQGGTTIKMIGKPHTAIVIGVHNTYVPLGQKEKTDISELNIKTTITDAYVPAGTNSFTVADATGFAVGDTILIKRPVTSAWLHFMKMDNLVRDGKKETWIPENTTGNIERKIVEISGNKITVNISLADSYDSKYLNPPGTIVSKVKPSFRITNVGVESLHIQCPPLESSYGKAPYSGVRIGGDDCWVKDIYCEETMNTTVLAGNRITMERVVIKHTYTNLGASKPTDFSIEGSQNLIDRCEITGGNTYFVWTSGLIAGPNVLLNCTFKGIGSRIQPHQRWATALLVDNCTVPDGGIDFMNRGVAGSGHGWTMGWAVAWNCIAKTYIIQNPPGTINWAIGCIGKREQTARLFDSDTIIPDGTFESHGYPVAPQSLYLAQLAERLGTQALININYSSNNKNQFKNKVVKPTPVQQDIDKTLGINYAFQRPVNTSNVRGSTREFGGEKAIDGNEQTYWATDDSVTHATLEIDMEGPVDINALQIAEPLSLGHHIQAYKIEGQVNSDWKLLSEGTTINNNAVARFPKTRVWKVRLTVLKASAFPAINKLSLFLSDTSKMKK